MLYLFVSNHNPKARADLRALIERHTKRAPETPVHWLEDDAFSADVLEAHRGAQGLFVANSIVVLDDVCQTAPHRDIVLEQAKSLNDSPNTFVIFERTLDVRTEKKLATCAEQVFAYKAESKQASKEANIFAITDAVGARDRKKAWTELHKLLFVGKSAEEIHGMVFWQFKNMTLVQNSNASAQILDMKPFVYNKAQRYAKNFSPEELKGYTKKLVGAYHTARAGGPELAIALEQFLLTI